MKKIIFTLIALAFINSNSLASEGTLKNLTCVTEHPSTSYFFNLQEDKYNLTVLHHNGVEHAPIHSGLVTIATIDYLKSSVENIKKLGDRIDVTFKASECIRLEENRVTCYISGEIKLGPLTVKDLYFNVYENSDSSTYGVFKDVRVSLDYRIGNRTFRMPMNFPVESCSNRFIKN